MLKIKTKKSLLTPENRRFIFPILLDLWYVPNSYASKYFKIVEEDDKANVFIFPLDINRFQNINKQELDNFINKAKSYDKPIWVYSAGDFGFTIDDPKVKTFRLGGFHSRLPENTEIMPSFINDPLEHIAEDNWQPVIKENLPKIGFVGLANANALKSIKSFAIYTKRAIKNILGIRAIDIQPYYNASERRSQYLQMLERSNLVKCQFIKREKYRAGVISEADRKQTSLEFYNNIYTTFYTFCMRGGGNFSVRLYETLALGRIPVLVNTDCRLPLYNTINWESHCVIVEEDDVESLPKILSEFHQSKSASGLAEMQENNRRLWKEKLTRINYFIEIKNKFKPELL